MSEEGATGHGGLQLEMEKWQISGTPPEKPQRLGVGRVTQFYSGAWTVSPGDGCA